MDINQIAKMIEWLDEERRRDKATIATLEERLASQQGTIDTLKSRLNSVESDQSVMRGQYMPTTEEQQLLEKIRKEVGQMMESTESRRLTAEREAERRQELNRENLQRSLREVTERIAAIEKHSTSISDLQSERDRLANSTAILQQRVDDVLKKLEEPDRRLAFLEEQRRQDARRISEAETEIPELKKQIDNLDPKLRLVQEMSIRNERRAQELLDNERERREQIQQFIDQQHLINQQRDQQVESLTKRFGEQEDTMQKNIDRFETWAEAYRNMKRIIDDFERIADRLERRINEVAEMQRLSEERFRQEWNSWRDDDQKRWKQFTLSNDEVWRNHDKEFEDFIKRVTSLDDVLKPVQDSVERLWNLERERAQLYRERYQALLLEYDTGKKTAATAQPTSTSTSTVPTVNNGTNGTVSDL